VIPSLPRHRALVDDDDDDELDPSVLELLRGLDGDDD
jgi:hypothetical protein